jgi:hypothetical protein
MNDARQDRPAPRNAPYRPAPPAIEVLVCLLVGLVIGTMFGAALENYAGGLVFGLAIGAALGWIKIRTRHDGP